MRGQRPRRRRAGGRAPVRASLASASTPAVERGPGRHDAATETRHMPARLVSSSGMRLLQRALLLAGSTAFAAALVYAQPGGSPPTRTVQPLEKPDGGTAAPGEENRR